MISTSNRELRGGEWYDRLPTDADRSTVPNIINAARGVVCNPDNRPLRTGYLAVYAIGSRAIGKETARSDIDILVAHNLYFSTSYRGPNVPGSSFLDSFQWKILRNDPVSSAVNYAVASDSKRGLPDEFSGELPDSYTAGEPGHKVLARYTGGTALDIVYYRGWHRNPNSNPTPYIIAAESIYEDPTSTCGQKCARANFKEGSTPYTFETIIDTDEHGGQLPRVPLYVLWYEKQSSGRIIACEKVFIPHLDVELP